MVREKNKSIIFFIKNIAIVVTFLIGNQFKPYSPDDYSLIVLMTISLCMILSIYLLILLVNSITNEGKLFDNRIEASGCQIYLYLTAFGYFIFLYLVNGNLQSIVSLFQSSPKIIITCTAIAVGAGFFEEYFVRGYLFNLIQRVLKKYKYKLTITAIITSIIFGLLHLLNLGLDSPKAVLQQVFYAFCLGLFFSLVRIITNSIYVGAFLHFLFDLQFGIYEQATLQPSWLLIILLFLPLAIISIVSIVSVESKVIANQTLLIKF